MATRSNKSNRFNFLLLPVFFFTFTMIGCSSSTKPGSSNAGTETEDANTNPSDNDATPAQTESDTNGQPAVNPADDASQNGEQTQTSDTVTGHNPSTEIEPVPSTENPGPTSPTTVRVDFDITVPAYQSSELRVELVWGDISLSASWVGDEYWSASGDFPTQTERLLSVTYYDQNGSLELAEYNQSFKTDVNVTEPVHITAEQFDSSLFDADGDGLSNLDELIAGNDPNINEDTLLEVRDFFNVGVDSRMSVSLSFESRLSDERPLFDIYDESELSSDFQGSVSGSAEIDEYGNGTLTYNYELYAEVLRLTGIRTHTESAITWEGDRYEYGGDYQHRLNFKNTVTLVDENTRHFVEEIVGSNSGTYRYTWETSSDLTGQLIDGTSLCKPVAGTVSIRNETNPGNLVTVVTISKEIDDPYWRLVRESNELASTEYFVRELLFHVPTGYNVFTALPEHKYFKCDFVDI